MVFTLASVWVKNQKFYRQHKKEMYQDYQICLLKKDLEGEEKI